MRVNVVCRQNIFRHTWHLTSKLAGNAFINRSPYNIKQPFGSADNVPTVMNDNAHVYAGIGGHSVTLRAAA